jgi:chromate transport protein ChrA
MNPLKYSLAEVQKAIISLLFLAGGAVGLFVATKPGFVEACVALVGPVFAAIGVFAAKNHTADDLQKALEQLKGAALAIVGYFTVVPTTTGERITALIGAVVSVFAVYWKHNEPPVPAPARVAGAN